MKHLKLSKKFTLDKKIFVLMITFTVGVMNLSSSNVVAEEVAATPPAAATTTVSPDGTVTIVRGAGETNNSCEAINDDLSTQLRSMTSACSAAGLRRNCLETLLQCDENMSGPESCDSLNDTLASAGSESQRERIEMEREDIEDLEDQKSALERLKNEQQDTLDDLNSSIADRRMERQALDRELQASIRTNDQNTANKINEIRAQTSQLQTERDAIFSQLTDQQRQTNEFMIKERLSCNSQARESGKNFYNYLRQCSEGRRQGCNLSLQSFVRGGNQSYSDMARNFEKRKVRECMRTDSMSDFAVKYRGFMEMIDLNKNLLNARNESINQRATELNTAIQLADQQGKLANSQATIDAAASIQIHEQETQRLMLRITEMNNNLSGYNEKLVNLDFEIQQKKDSIREYRSNSSGVGRDDLSGLQDAHANAQSLIDKAKDAMSSRGCECSGAIQTISDRSGLNFCDSSGTDIIPTIEDDGTN